MRAAVDFLKFDVLAQRGHYKAFPENQPGENYQFPIPNNEEFKKAIINSGRKQWIICGIEAHICVYQTIIGLLNANFEVEIPVDCVSSRTEENKTMALNKLQKTWQPIFRQGKTKSMSFLISPS